VTGFDSVAQLARGGEAPVRAKLAVADQMALPTAFVLENFLRILAAYLSSSGSAWRGINDSMP
jgi:hypothetical protein